MDRGLPFKAPPLAHPAEYPQRALSLMVIPFPFNAWMSTSSLRVIMEVRAFLEN